jgi:hypothetical protein
VVEVRARGAPPALTKPPPDSWTDVWRSRHRWAGYLLAFLVAGCGWWKSSSSLGANAPPDHSYPRIGQRHVDHRPKLATLIRQGDPQAALALVLGHVGSFEDSIQLAALLGSRLSKSSPPIEVLPHIAGVTLVAAVESPSAARQLVARLDQAIRFKVEDAELAQPSYRFGLQRLQQAMNYQVPVAERDLCLFGAQLGNRSVASVEQARQRLFSEDRARWGIVGSREVVEAVDAAIRVLAPWPRTADTVASRPTQDQAVFVPTRGGSPHIDVAWRASTARKVLGASRELRSASSSLREILAALPTSMRLDRVAETPLVVGGCLALSLSQEAQRVPATIDELIATVRIVAEELRRISRQPLEEELTTLAVVEQPDPRRAAELAALVALSNDDKTNLDRFRIEVDVGSNLAASNPTSRQQRALAGASTPPSALGTVPLVHATEHGQGSLHALLASPCAIWSESSRSVGATGLLVRTLASRYHELQSVVVEPWITADGVGLVAHTRRLSVEETPEKQAERLGDVLGRVLTTLRFESSNLWDVRSDLLARLGPGPRPALWRAVLALSPQYPALVAPEGTFTSIAGITVAGLLEHRAQFLQMPLRLAVLENHGVDQAEALRHSLMRWLSMFRFETAQCPQLDREVAPRPLESRIESRFPDPDDAAVTAAMSLPTQHASDEGHAELLLWLLNRPDGWLARSLHDSNIVATADARVVGGLQRRGLVVAIGATTSSLDAATATIRKLFQGLGVVALPQPSNITEAIAQVQQADRRRRMDPRARLQDVWLGRSRTDKVDETSFRDYLKRAFSASNLVLVRSSQRTNPEPVVGGRGKH